MALATHGNFASLIKTREKRFTGVQAWEEDVVIPTYPAPAPDPNPMFIEKRVYQGSSGRVYPLAFTDRVSDRKIDRSYQAVFLENEYILLMLLPEIGGRIHVGFDKTNEYDFFYRQRVIKPALVGLAGPWISGGVEFNWPQHHRPSTFLPVDHSIEQHADGGCTVWLSEHEPMNRMKGMVGICLHPGKSIVEAKVRLYNRTPYIQTFLWWANVGVHVHDQYQSFFPPDVTFVADHARRAMSSFPIARNFYYGVDYTAGVDLTWYKNIPVPTSYMVTRSKYDFVGGYDHARKAGLVHVANRHIVPGKKQWTWGNADFGYAWDRELTDEDGPYIELMAGAYTDNQPDFSFLQPFETRTFSQFWYPIREIGPARNANRRVAVNFEVNGKRLRAGVCATETFENARIVVTAGAEPLIDKTVSIGPGRPAVWEENLERAYPEPTLLLRVLSVRGEELIRYRPEEPREEPLPAAATEPLPPNEIATSDELYLTGLHLDQYRHATRHPELYWEEALRRDPDDVRCNNAMGLLALRRGEFAPAEAHFRRAVERLTRRNANPLDGEPHYNLGLSLRFLDRLDEAYAALYKATWNRAWQAPAYYALAQIDGMRADFEAAREHLDRALAADPQFLQARNLKTALLRILGRVEESAALAAETVRMDALDFWSRNELRLATAAADSGLFERMRGEHQTCLDIALDYAGAGLWGDAIALIRRFRAFQGGDASTHPMLQYALGFFLEKAGDTAAALEAYREASAAPSAYCFPSRLEEMIILEAARKANPGDARAAYYLGNLFYDKRRYHEAIQCWKDSRALDPGFAIPWRNLGIAAYNIGNDFREARHCYQKAFEANPADARLLYEWDQLEKRIGAAPRERLERLEAHPGLVDHRDDLVVELVTLYNLTGRHEKALAVLASRKFHPWEGGEGLVSGQYVAAHLALGRALLESNRPEPALAHFESARNYPHNLGEGKHLLTSEADLDYFSGVALRRLERADDAAVYWRKAAESNGGPTPATFYRALALAELGSKLESHEVLRDLLQDASRQLDREVQIDYFATSLPNFLLFEDDLQKRNRVECLFLIGLAQLGFENREAAAGAFREVLLLDVNHLRSQQELESLRASPLVERRC
jgi:tetratricopeptide (TPR) repeat protein